MTTIERGVSLSSVVVVRIKRNVLVKTEEVTISTPLDPPILIAIPHNTLTLNGDLLGTKFDAAEVGALDYLSDVDGPYVDLTPGNYIGMLPIMQNLTATYNPIR